jgi:predicted amidohydrolase
VEEETMTDALPIGVLHLDVKHGRVEEKRDALAASALEAARKGPSVVVAPELAVFGYSFKNRTQIAAYAETLTGPTFKRLAPVARDYGTYIRVGKSFDRYPSFCTCTL